jgi:glycosyltransferase involved in cell wall biosynthesis
MRRIAYVDELAFTKRHGGSATATIKISSYLHELKGFDTEIFSFPNSIKTNIPDKIKFLPNLREIFIFPFVGDKLISNLEKEYDLIHFSSTTTMAFHKSCIPTVLTTHCIFSRQTKILKESLPLYYSLIFNKMNYNLFKELERRSFENVDHIIVPKTALKKFLIDELRIPYDKISIIAQGIDTEFFKQLDNQAGKDNSALFVGRGSIAKGFDILIQAADLIKTNIIAVVPRISRLYKRIAEKKRNLTLITSKLDHSKLVKLYQKATVFIMPSLSETGPLVTLEAMGCGLPIVCTSEGGGDFVENGVNGFVVPNRDPVALAEKVNYTLDNIDIAQRFGKESRKRAENFSIRNTVEKTAAIYHSLGI